MMRILAALAALIGMSGCTVVVLGAGLGSTRHSNHGDDAELGQALLAAVLLDVTVISWIANHDSTPEPTTSTMSWR